jgi:hypothetical protein
VICVILKPGLQPANRFSPLRSAAIDKCFPDSRHFRHMGMGRNFTAGWQDESDVLAGMFRQLLF